jgi:hypothetical protein
MKTLSFLWPDHVIGKRESRRIRLEHNKLVNSHAELLELAKSIAVQDEFTFSDDASIPLRQAYAIINQWRNAANAAIKKAKESYE